MYYLDDITLFRILEDINYFIFNYDIIYNAFYEFIIFLSNIFII